MHTWGKKLGIWAILTSLVFSVLGPVFSFRQAEAATLPATVKDFILQDKARTKDAIVRASDTNTAITEFVQVLHGDADALGNIEAQANYLIDRFAAGDIKQGMTVHKLDFNDWEGTYKNVYNSTYAQVRNLSFYWGDFLSQMSIIHRFVSTNDANYEQFRRDVQWGQDMLYLENKPGNYRGILPYLSLVYLGTQILAVLNKNEAVRADASDMADFDLTFRDLDTRPEQGSRLIKRLQFEQAIQNGGQGEAPDSSVYISTAAFYNDVKRFGNLLIEPPVSTYTDANTAIQLQKRLLAAAVAMDKDTKNSVDPTGGKSRFDRCGQASKGSFDVLPNIGESITAALCSIVILIQDFSISTLTTSLGLLGTVSGIKDLEASAGSEPNFLVSLIPKEFTAQFLELALEPPANPKTDTEVAATSFNKILKNAHGVILNVLNSLLVLIFIAIALSNILQIQVSNYSVQKLFAPIVIGFLLATGSWFMIRGMVELAGAASGGILTQFSLESKGKTASNNFLNATKKVGSVGGDPTYSLTEPDGNAKRPSFSKVFQQAILNLFTLAAAVVVFILAFLFMIRALFLSFLIPLSPIAFFASAVPPLKSVWAKWSKPFFQWLIMPIIAAFWIWLGFVWLASVNIDGAAGKNAIQAIIAYLFGMVCFTAAIKSSLSSLSGEAKMVMDKWQGMGKTAWGNTGGALLKSGQKSAGRGLQTFAYNKNLLGIPGLMEANKQRDAISKQKLENAQKKYASRDNYGNRNRAAKMAIAKTDSDILDAKKKQIEMETKLGSDEYKQKQRALGKIQSYEEKLGEVLKSEIKLRKDAIDVKKGRWATAVANLVDSDGYGPGFTKKIGAVLGLDTKEKREASMIGRMMNRKMTQGKKSKMLYSASEDYHAMEAKAITLSGKLAEKALKDQEDFEKFLDKEEQYQVRDEKGNKTGSNIVRNARIQADGLKMATEKLEEERRMQEHDLFDRAASTKTRLKRDIDELIYEMEHTPPGQEPRILTDVEKERFFAMSQYVETYYRTGVDASIADKLKEGREQFKAGKISVKDYQTILKNASSQKEKDMAKRAGTISGMYRAKKADDIVQENDIEALAEVGPKGTHFGAMVNMMGGEHHANQVFKENGELNYQETIKKQQDIERAAVAFSSAFSGKDYDPQQIAVFQEFIDTVASTEKHTDIKGVTKIGLENTKRGIAAADENLRGYLANASEKTQKSIRNALGQDYDFTKATTSDLLRAMRTTTHQESKQELANIFQGSGAAEAVGLDRRATRMSNEVMQGVGRYVRPKNERRLPGQANASEQPELDFGPDNQTQNPPQPNLEEDEDEGGDDD
jgi:hypothetical protein